MNESQLRLLERSLFQREWLKKHPQLRTLFWECTLRCNLACRHCGSACLPEARQKDMPLSHFLPVLDEIALHADPRRIIVFTVGGEPLLRPDLIECAHAITSRGFNWGFVTNGMLLDLPILQKLIDARVKSIAVSIDGLKEDHNWMRGHDHSFQRAVRAVRLLQHTRHVAWDVITCVSRRNYPHLNALRDFFVQIGLQRWRIFTIFPAGRAKDDEQMVLTPEEFHGLMEFIKDTRQEGLIRLSYSCEGFLGEYEGLVRGHAFRCDAGLTVASVLADGSISGCLSIRSEYHQGNIYTDSFWDVWQQRFQHYRQREWMHRDACAQCDAWRYCEVNGMHLRTDDGQLMHCNYKKLLSLIVDEHN